MNCIGRGNFRGDTDTRRFQDIDGDTVRRSRRLWHINNIRQNGRLMRSGRGPSSP